VSGDPPDERAFVFVASSSRLVLLFDELDA